MKNKGDLIVFLNVSVVLFHLALLGIVIGEPFEEGVNLTLSIFISVFLIVFSYLIEKKTNNRLGTIIYHLVGCWSLVVSYFYLMNTEIIYGSLYKGHIDISIFFLLISLLSILSAVRLKIYQFIHISYLSLIFMTLSILSGFNIDSNFSCVILTLIISIIVILVLYKEKNTNNFISFVTFLATTLFLITMFNTGLKYIVGISLITLISSLFKIFIFKDKREQNYVGFKLMLIIYISASLISNVTLQIITSITAFISIYAIIVKKSNIKNSWINALFIFMTLLIFNHNVHNAKLFLSFINQNSLVEVSNIVSLIISIGYLVAYYLNKDQKVIKCISLCFSILFAFNYLITLITNEELKAIITSVAVIFTCYNIMNYLFKDAKNKDAFMTILLACVLLTNMGKDALLINIYTIVVSVIALYIGITNKEYRGIKIVGIVFLIIGIKDLIEIFNEVPFSIYLLILGVVLSIYFLNRLNNKNYCKHCGVLIKDKGTYCANCGKKL